MGTLGINKSRIVYGEWIMNIVIVYPEPDVKRKPRFGFSYDMLLIATVLEEKHNVIIKDFSCEEYSDNWLMELVQNISIDIILVECDSFALKRSQNIICADKIIRSAQGCCKTIAYGNYCYITQREFSCADFTIKQNDINVIIDVVNSLDSFNKVRYYTVYDDLPYINRQKLLNIPFYNEHKNCTLIQTAKGCENTCIFCQRKGWQSNYITHSDEYVMQEVKLIKEQGFSEIWIIDENFSFNLVRAKRLMNSFIEKSLTDGMNIFISSWANIDEEFLDLAARANIKIISFGIETGNEKILQFYKKNIQLNTIQHKIQYANQKGIFTVGNFIIGAPMETRDTIQETFELIRKCQFDQINIKILDYMIGSDLYNSLEDSIKKSDSVFACKENGLTTLSMEEMKTIKESFIKEYYSEHRNVIAKKIMQFGKPYSL